MKTKEVKESSPGGYSKRQHGLTAGEVLARSYRAMWESTYKGSEIKGRTSSVSLNKKVG